MIVSFNNHDSDAVARIYDELSDKDKYNDDIIKLILVSLARIENIINKGYNLQHNDAILEKTVVELNKDVDSIEDNISLELPEENKEDEEEVEDIEIPEEVESAVDIDLLLDNFYGEYKNAMGVSEYYKARDILLKYNYYCREYNIDDDCFHDLFILTNKIDSLEFEDEEREAVSFFIQEIRSNFVNGRLKNDKETVKKLLDEFRTLPSSDKIYYYHRYRADYLMNISNYSSAINEYEKAVEINPYNKHDYYKLAILCYISMKSNNNRKKALKFMNDFTYYSRNTFSPSQLSLLANIYIFNFMRERAIEILERVEQFDENYKSKFFKQFSSSYLKKYNTLKKMQYSNRKNQKEFAETFFESDYLSIFTKYALIYSGNFDDVFNKRENPYQQELENAKAIADSDSMTKLSDIDKYFLGLDLTKEDNINLMLDMVVYFTEKGFYDKASKYIKIVEKVKNKSNEVKEKLNETRSKVKIRKIANKNRR